MDDPKRRDVAEQLNNYSSELKKLHKFTAAAIALERAIEILPDSGTLWSNLGAVKWSQNDFVTAEKCMMKALELGYDNDKINCNLGLLMSSMNRWDEAEKYFQRSMSQAPEEHLAEWEDSLTCLDKGDWINGFKKYDIRRQIKKEYNALKYPFWNGEDLNGKTIYIQAEQGLGDRFLFHRYLYWLKEKYPTVKILYLCDSALHNLFWELKLATGLEFIPNKVPWPKADYGQYLMNLPRFHGTTPDNVYPDPGLIRKRVEPYKNACNLPAPELSSLKVGICWTGNPVMEQNIQRSVPLEMMLELAKDSKVVLYNFQVGKEGSDAINNLGADGLICDIGPGLEKEGWVGTALAMLNMDLIITCCTSIAHLAGTLNIPCWVMLCSAPYWVWLRDREDSVWYPSVRLFRQTEPGEWRPVINRVRNELTELIKKQGV